MRIKREGLVITHLRGFHKSLPGLVRRVKMDIWPFPYGDRPAAFRFHGRRDNFNNPYGRRCVNEVAPNSPAVFIKPTHGRRNRGGRGGGGNCPPPNILPTKKI